MEARLAAADMVIFLDLPRLLCLWRIVWRRFRYCRRTRPDMAEGCREQLSRDFALYVWRYPEATRPRVLARLAAVGSGTRVVHLRSRSAVRAFLRSVRASAQPHV